MPNTPELVWLDNLTPKSTRFDDTYYSRQNGLDETRYVFINGNKLPQRWQQGEAPLIGELGFGTGLNFLATWQAWLSAQNQQNKHISQTSNRPSIEKGTHNASKLTFLSVEKYPMPKQDLHMALSPWPELEPLGAKLLALWNPTYIGWQTLHFGPVTLLLFIGDAYEGLLTIPHSIDAWYLDGFNPKTNPELWSLDLLRTVSEASTPNATLASYTAAGWVRRNLQEAGFTIAKRKGFGHKRDMITGTKTISHIS